MGKNKEQEKKSMATTSHEENRGEPSSSLSSIVNDPHTELAYSISAKLSSAGSSTPTSNQLSIYRVHKKFRKINKFAYRPEMVSIGPFHHKKRSLPKMDQHKLRYVYDFFSRPSTTTTIRECVILLKGLEEKARKCYSENSFGSDDDDYDDDDQKKEKIKLDSDEFVKMMLFDGLFIIELFRKDYAKKMKEVDGGSSHSQQQQQLQQQQQQEDEDDLVFSNIWRKSSLIRDMILLGNQLPMFVLEHLFTMSTTTNANDTSPSCSLTMLALHFFNPLMPRTNEVLEQYAECKGMHLLDLFKKTFQVQLDVFNLQQPAGTSDTTLTNTNNNKTTNQSKFIPSVTELRVAGVTFEILETDSFLRIEFDSETGVMKIPSVVIHEQMGSLMNNLIAAEQYYDGGANNYSYMTSYAFLMDSLLNSPKDVEFLRGQGIIVRYLNKDNDVSDLFTKLCTEITLANFYYSELCDKVNAYYDTHWRVWRASWLETAKREFFNNPWTIFSFFAAVVIIFLTLLQTIFTVLSYYQKACTGQNAKP